MMKISTIYLRLPNWIGDVCMSLPSLQLLLDSKLDIVVCAKPWAQDLLSAYKIANFINISGNWKTDRKSILQHKKNHKNNSVALLLPDSLSSALVFGFTGVKTAGYIDDGRRLFLDWAIKKPKTNLHAVESWFHLTYTSMQKWQIPCSKDKPNSNLELKISELHTQQAKQSLAIANLNPNDFILIAPTATGIHKGKNKVWPYFNQFTKEAIANGYKVVMCPPSSEIDQAKSNAPDALILDPLNLGAFAALTKQAKIVICNDSGVSHIASAAGANQITLFGVTDISRTGPWSDKAICLGSSTKWASLKDVSEVVYSNI